MPFGALYIIKKQTTPLAHPRLKAKIGTLYQNVETVGKPKALLFTSVFLIRRLVFAAIVVLISEPNILVQLFLSMYASFGMIMFYVIVWPMNNVVNNIQQLINEVFLYMCLLFSLAFTDYTVGVEQKHDVGTFYLTFLAFNITINVALIMYTAIKQGIDHCRKKD